MFNVSLNTGSANYAVSSLGPQGSQSLFSINGVGNIAINDLGTNALGPNGGSFYACIMFADQVWAFSYDGGGQLNLNYNQNELEVTATNGTVTEMTAG